MFIKRSLPFLLVLSSFHLSAQIVNIESSRLDETQQGWQGLIDLNFYAIQNANILYQLNNKARVQYIKNRHRWLVLNDMNLSTTNDLKFEQNAFQHIRYGLMIDSPIVWESFIQNQYDKVQLIKQRVLLGTGLRLRFLEKGLIHSYYGITYMLEYEKELKTGILHLNSRMSTYINLKLTISDWFIYYNTSYYQPLFANFSDYRFTTNNTLEFKVNNNFSFVTRFTMTYDSNPVQDPSVHNKNLKLTNGFSYKFK